MADELRISEIMGSINKMNRIQSIRWTEIPGSCEWDGFEHKPKHRPALTVTDIDGNDLTIALHPPGDPEHEADRVAALILVWLIQSPYGDRSAIPLGDLADMVNPCRQMVVEQKNVKK